MKNIIIVLIIFLFAIFLYGGEDNSDLMKLLNLSSDISVNNKYPSLLLNRYNYMIYFKARTYSQIIDVNNYNYNEGSAINFRVKNIKLAVGAEMEQLGIGNYNFDRYSVMVASRLVDLVNLGVDIDFKKFSYISAYSDPVLTTSGKMYIDADINCNANIYKEFSLGFSINNILNSELVEGGFIDYANIITGIGYNFKGYGIFSVGYDRKEGYNNYLIGYAIKYKSLYAQLNYDFLSMWGKVVLDSYIVNKIKLRFIGDISYIFELGTVYNVGIILIY